MTFACVPFSPFILFSNLCSMNPKREKVLGLSALLIVIVTGVLLYMVKPTSFSNPAQTEYLLKVLLYPAGLVLIRAVWKFWLDEKIRGKAERVDGFNQMVEEVNNNKESNEH